MRLMVSIDDDVRISEISICPLVKDLCDAIQQCKNLKALRLEGNTINEEAATAIGKALEKHSEIEVNRFAVTFDRSYWCRLV